MNSEKYIGLDVHQATIVVAVTDCTGLCRLAREFGGDLRGRNLVGLAVRSAQSPCGETGGVQSAQERAAQGREQE